MMAAIVPASALWCQEKTLLDIVVRLQVRETEIKARPGT